VRLVYYSWKWKENNSFLPNYFQVPSKVPQSSSQKSKCK
jgi:hypothetical protein